MEVNLTARHFTLSDSLRGEVQKATDKFQRFHENIISADVILTNENAKLQEQSKVAEFIVKVQDHTVVVKEQSENFGKSIHEATDKVVRQLRKLKEKYN